MGYYIFQEDANFFIDNKHVGDVVRAVHRLALDKEWVGGRDNNDITQITDPYEIFSIFSWNIERNDIGDIVDITFEGEKMHDEQELFNAIAQFVKNDCYIQMRGEDHEQWRWSFTNGVMTEQTATITWE